MSMEALLTLHLDLERKGPGCEESTLRALARCRPLPPDPVVVDLGCGSGASTLLLARTLRATVKGLDLHPAFLEELRRRAEAEGLSHLVLAAQGDFRRLDLAPRSVDLLWSEGAIYLAGWRQGLEAWKRYVRPGGFMAVTEATWLVPDPPEEARRRWSLWYPGMGTVESNLTVARELGLQVLEAFLLPASAWWAYLDPLWEHCEASAELAKRDPELRTVIADLAQERDLYRLHGDSYGYVFYVLRVPEEEA